jgi:hypothetical protein
MNQKGEIRVDVNGIAALAIVKMLLDVLQKKQVLTHEEIDIILNCAEVEVGGEDKTDLGARLSEAKLLISNLMKDSDDTTMGINQRTRS